jgi:hypothetical protein
MDHTSHTRLGRDELTLEFLDRASIYGDEKIWTVSHLHGSQIWLSGGFLGIGAKPVAVAADQLGFMRDSDGSAERHA